MSGFEVLSYVKKDKREDIVINCGSIVHLIVCKRVGNNNENVLETPSKLRLYIRENQEENIVYENLFNIIAMNCGVTGTDFVIHLFENSKGHLLFEIICFYFRTYLNQDLIVESNEKGFVIKKDGNLLFESFI